MCRGMTGGCKPHRLGNNCAAHLTVQSAGAVDTSIPTAPGKTFGYIVEYGVEDRAHNTAPTARRLISVVCPGKESYCIDPDTGSPICTIDGQCGKPAALSDSAVSTTTATSHSKGAPASSSLATSSTASTKQTVATPPTLTLVGPSTLEITAGDVYDRCSSTAALDVKCERGATASDTKDGIMDRQVYVCGNK